tara:strand:- start:122522 stop:126055 length:3534 start_codon:yes stop_codon:yes gene_type:complete
VTHNNVTHNIVTDETSPAQNFGPEPEQVARFIEHWAASGGAERANFPPFARDLCDVLAVPHPDPTKTDVAGNAYVFERDVTFQNQDGSTSPGRIDLYKRGCFVLEAKQGTEKTEADDSDELKLTSAPKKKTKRGTAIRGTKGWDDAMVKARGQAEQYARALPTDEGWPPFLIVVDVGHSIELFADFTRSGKTYLPFPDPGSFRIRLEQLADDEQREKLRTVWTDPLSLDPSRRSAKVTRELADRLARLAKSMEGSGYEASRVSQFLMRCLFTMFAEDVELIPEDSFTELLISLKGDTGNFPDLVRSLWESMDQGTFHPVIRKKLKRFNGGLFEDCEALPLNDPQLELLIEAARSNWREVEPAIFGTLLERALDPVERHKLGAHYTPRAYVERLVMPTIIDPLRDEWDAVRTAAITLATRGDSDEAIETVRSFHGKLCETRILDPACGSGNFLYVALEHMKRLEGEVLNTLRELGYRQTELLTVDPHQFLGIEVNPRAAAIADLVLWIGYLQWHIRTRDLSQIAEPIIRKFHNIECRDAVLAWDAVEPVLDDNGEPVTRWDGRTTKPHPVTGEEVPDDSARVPVLKYINPRKADWPEADYVVGNPPFIGNWRMRQALGDGYSETIRTAYPEVPETCDYVMYWWDRAAEAVQADKLKRFGLITTNSLRQKFSRRVLNKFLQAKTPLSLDYAVPDHPWVDASEGAAVRISMTVASAGSHDGLVEKVIAEAPNSDGDVDVRLLPKYGPVHSDLSIGADVAGAGPLQANEDLSCPGVKLHGSGFIVTPDEAEQLGLGRIDGLEKHIRNYRNGRDLTASPRGVMVIDLFGLSEDEVRSRFPEVNQWVRDRVKPERDQNNRATYRDRWWLFGEPRGAFRPALSGLKRYIVTVETAKHRFFVFHEDSILPDNMLIAIAIEDAFHLGVLNSRIHVCWALAAGGWLGYGNDPRYTKSRCFEPFPFPVAGESQQSRIRELGEQLDAHRKRQQAQHPKLTMTSMYNVLEKLRAGEPLTDKDKTIHEQGLVSVLKQIHDDLDAAVFEAYGWPVTLTDEEILERLVALNAERAAEEQRGLIRWLRPEFQNPDTGEKKQKDLAIETDDEDKPAKKRKAKKKAATKKLPLPKKLAEQVVAIRQQLATSREPLTATDMARRFSRAKPDQVEELLQSLTVLGSAREVEPGKYVSA